jgi:hypothetical protein
MPNGTSAPGNVLPPLLVHVLVSTSWAMLEVEVELRMLVFFDPAGWFFAAGRPAHATRPVEVVVQASAGVRAVAFADGFEGVRAAAVAGTADSRPPMTALAATGYRYVRVIHHPASR